ncbi:MAG: hypothetical protein WD069_04375 [Planctomycetales bacterium]
MECRPSRVDLAWDFGCDDACTPDDVIGLIEPHAKSAGYVIGIAGQDGRNTRYIGSPTSPRRLRIYRKDWEDEYYARTFGPTMRVELILKGAHAAMWWLVWAADAVRGWAVGVGHVYEMTGFVLEREMQDVPAIKADPAVTAEVRLRRFAKQYGPTIMAYYEAGVPLLEYIERVRQETTCRMERSRYLRRVEELRASGLAELVRSKLDRESPALCPVCGEMGVAEDGMIYCESQGCGQVSKACGCVSECSCDEWRVAG